MISLVVEFAGLEFAVSITGIITPDGNMKIKSEFEFDNLMSATSFSEMRKVTPAIKHVPTMYSHGKCDLYIASMDVSVKTDDVVELKFLLNSVLRSFVEHVTSTRRQDAKLWDMAWTPRLYGLEIDVTELCNCLFNLNPESICGCPEEVLYGAAHGTSVEELMARV